MKILRATLDNCAGATGVAVAIDVIRAFTTAAFGLAAGAERILLCGTVAEALALREHFPGSLVMGEVGGLQPPGFDFGNSPAALTGLDLSGRTLIQRTSAGTQGPVRAARAAAVFGASFVVAGATAHVLRAAALQLEEVTLIATGVRPEDNGDEDVALADYLQGLLRGDSPDPAPYLDRARRSAAAQKFYDPAQLDFPAADMDCCLALDRFNFALRVTREEGLLVLNKQII